MKLQSGEILTIPSPIDVHVHLREPGGVEKETIESGTRAALYGGYQAVFDMPNNPGGNETWASERMLEKYAIAGRTALTSIGFYAGVNLGNPDIKALQQMVPDAAGLKLYMGHTTGNAKEYSLEDARPAIDAWIRTSKKRSVKSPILLHAREDVGHEAAEYIAEQSWPVHWCHVSTETEANHATHLTKFYPNEFTAGVTPHHLTMTSIDADFKYGWAGARMMPPLASEADHEALLDAFNAGYIKILETDHAPHSVDDKKQAENDNPEGNDDTDCVTCFGISGIEFVLPIMTSLVQREKISMDRLIDALHTQPAQMLGLETATSRSKTMLEIGPYTIEERDRAGKSSNNPYVGWTGWARVIQITKRGVGLLNEERKIRDERIANSMSQILKYGSHL